MVRGTIRRPYPLVNLPGDIYDDVAIFMEHIDRVTLRRNMVAEIIAVPLGALPRELGAHLNRYHLKRYLAARTLPPIVICNGAVFDGAHRVARARFKFLRYVNAVDFTCLGMNHQKNELQGFLRKDLP